MISARGVRRGATVLAGLLTALLFAGSVAPASAAAAPCVGVIVDAQLLGGTVATGCAVGDPRTGLAALVKAGFAFTPRPRDGLICQVAAQPASCATTTTTAYWSYWYRSPGSTAWVYANQGAGTHDPKPGSTEAWVWQDGGRRPPPDIALATICPQVVASPTPAPTRTKTAKPTPKPTPKPTRTRSASPTPSRSTTSASSRPSRTRRRATPTPTPTSATPTPPPSTPITTPTAPASTPATQPSTPAAAVAPEPPADKGGPALPTTAGAALGAALILGLGAAAFVRSRRSAP